jgi:hypothetical protein
VTKDEDLFCCSAGSLLWDKTGFRAKSMMQTWSRQWALSIGALEETGYWQDASAMCCIAPWGKEKAHNGSCKKYENGRHRSCFGVHINDLRI